MTQLAEISAEWSHSEVQRKYFWKLSFLKNQLEEEKGGESTQVFTISNTNNTIDEDGEGDNWKDKEKVLSLWNREPKGKTPFSKFS